MLSNLFRPRLKEALRQAYDAGLAKGYELGWQMRGTKESSKGFIISSRVDKEIEAILRKKH